LTEYYHFMTCNGLLFFFNVIPWMSCEKTKNHCALNLQRQVSIKLLQ